MTIHRLFSFNARPGALNSKSSPYLTPNMHIVYQWYPRTTSDEDRSSGSPRSSENNSTEMSNSNRKYHGLGGLSRSFIPFGTDLGEIVSGLLQSPPHGEVFPLPTRLGKRGPLLRAAPGGSGCIGFV